MFTPLITVCPIIQSPLLFISYLGHSICDAHFGAGKKKLRSIVGSGVLMNKDTIIEAFDSVKNTVKGQFLEWDTKTDEVSKLKKGVSRSWWINSNQLGQMKFYQFFIKEIGVIWCKELFDSGEWVRQTLEVGNKAQNEEVVEEMDDMPQYHGIDFGDDEEVPISDDEDSHDDASIDSDYENSDESEESEEEPPKKQQKIHEDRTVHSLDALYGKSTGAASKSIAKVGRDASALVTPPNKGYHLRKK